jgi:hypothetical protein
LSLEFFWNLVLGAWDFLGSEVKTARGENGQAPVAFL